jgi:hypothetical protein
MLAAGAGMARAYTFDRPVQKAPQIEAAEAEARAAGRGLWGAGCPDEAAESSTTATTPPTSAVKTAVVVPAQPPVPTTTHRRATPTSKPVAAPPVPVPDVARTVKTTTPKPTTPRPTTEKQPAATTTKTTTKAAPTPSGGGCDPNYSGCVPIASDVDCAGGSGNGPAYLSGPVRVTGTDVYGLDADNDGLGCE